MGAYKNGSELITPSLDDVRKLTDAGADIVAIDGTKRLRPDGNDGFRFIEEVRNCISAPIWADIASFQEGIRCAEIGVDIVATTLSGYTSDTAQNNVVSPDFELIQQLSSSLIIPVIAEGRVLTPVDAQRCMQFGAFAVVVGTAITRPSLITKMFTNALNSGNWGNF